MSSWWRKLAENLGATEGTGSWKRRVARHLNATGGKGPWSRRIVGVVNSPKATGTWAERLVEPGSTRDHGPSWPRRLVTHGARAPIGNSPPTGIVLTDDDIAETAAIGDAVGHLIADDPDTDETHTFTKTADPDNKFTVEGNELRLAASVRPAGILAVDWDQTDGDTPQDRSDSGKVLTYQGGAVVSGGKVVFDGVDDYVELPLSEDWRPAGDFFWDFEGVVFDTTLTTYQSVCRQWVPDQQNFALQWAQPLGTLRFIAHTLSGTSPFTVDLSHSWTPVADQAYRISVERSGNVWRLYLDGVMVAKQTVAHTLSTSTATPGIGGPTSPMKGSIKACQFRNGVAPVASDDGYTPTALLPDVSHSVTIQAEDESGETVDGVFTVNVLPTITNDSGIGEDDGTVVDDGGFDVVVVEDTKDALKISGKSGGLAKMIFDIGAPAPEASGVYTVRYDPDWSQLTKQGAKAFVGFGIKNGDNFQFAGLKGDGGSGLNVYQIGGSFAAKSGFTFVDGGVAANGTQDGPNWLQFEVGSDGALYSLRSGTGPDKENVTWTDELVDQDADPLTNVTDATEFGLAVFLENDDKGVFSVDITAWSGAPPISDITLSNDTITA